MGIYGQRKRQTQSTWVVQCKITEKKKKKIVGRTLTVQYLDAIDGTPVLDIKPIIKEFLPKGEIKSNPI